MKRIILLGALFLISCQTYTIETKLKLHYVDGTTEVITLKRESNISGKHVLFNGCLYRRKHIGSFIGEEDSYIGQIRCGVSYYKTLSIRKYTKPTN